MGGCCGKPVEGRKEGWGGAEGSGRTGAGGGGGGDVLVFVGLNGAGKSALLHTLQQHDSVKPSTDAGGTSVALSPASGHTAGTATGYGGAEPTGSVGNDDGNVGGVGGNKDSSGLAFTLDVQEGVLCAPPPTTEVTVTRIRAAGVAFTAVDVPGDRSDRGMWTAAVEGRGGGKGGGRGLGATTVVFVVDAADELRMPVAREELWVGVAGALVYFFLLLHTYTRLGL